MHIPTCIIGAMCTLGALGAPRGRSGHAAARGEGGVPGHESRGGFHMVSAHITTRHSMYGIIIDLHCGFERG